MLSRDAWRWLGGALGVLLTMLVLIEGLGVLGAFLGIPVFIILLGAWRKAKYDRLSERAEELWYESVFRSPWDDGERAAPQGDEP